MLIAATSHVCADTLSYKNADWTAVLGGRALCRPEQTSYGFAVLTDGKTLCTYTEKGAPLWERSVKGRAEPFLQRLANDFLLTITDKKSLSLINPSGLTLWTVQLPFATDGTLLIGRDDRLFLKGKKEVACYGVNGIRKWTLDTPETRPNPPLELNDGSVLVLLSALEDGKTKALRLSPFGEILESIVFSAEIQTAYSTQKGVLLSFSGGSAGMCRIQDGKTATKWIIPQRDKAFGSTTAQDGSVFFTLSRNRGGMALSSGGGTRVLVFSLEDGRTSDFFDVPVRFKEAVCIQPSSDGESIFVCGKKEAFLYTSAGKCEWQAALPAAGDVFSKWNHIFFSQENMLVICSTSWAMAGFRTKQTVHKKSAAGPQKKPDYRAFLPEVTDYFQFQEELSESLSGQDRAKRLRNGGYGTKEAEYLSALGAFADEYRSFLMQSASRPHFAEQSVFQRDTAGVETLILQLNLFGTERFQKTLASLIRTEGQMALLAAALRSVSECGFDPDGSILSSMDARLQTIPAQNTAVLCAFCDATYEICRFMGRPALYAHGMELLKTLFSPQYGSEVKDYARKTLTKIASLKI